LQILPKGIYYQIAKASGKSIKLFENVYQFFISWP